MVRDKTTLGECELGWVLGRCVLRPRVSPHPACHGVPASTGDAFLGVKVSLKMHMLRGALTHLAHSHSLAYHLAFSFFSGEKRVLREWEFLNRKKRVFVAMLDGVKVPGPEVGEEDEDRQGAHLGRPDFSGCARVRGYYLWGLETQTI